jgi:thioredoxin-dependent peroxiredoxin
LEFSCVLRENEEANIVAAKNSKTGPKKVSTGNAKSPTLAKSKVLSPAGKASKKTATKAVTKKVIKPRAVEAAQPSAEPHVAQKKVSAKKATPNAEMVKGPKPSGAVSPKAQVSSKPSAVASTSKPALALGDQVPTFTALDQNGQRVSNEDWAGAPYVLYFYPKDDTPGCTTQACGFRDELPSFDELGVKVVGCSPDSPNAHTRFAHKYGLEFTLLADIEKELTQLFGVWKLKHNYGREYMGVERSTFLIDKHGKVARQWRGVRVAGHVPEVLQAVLQLR